AGYFSFAFSLFVIISSIIFFLSLYELKNIITNKEKAKEKYPAARVEAKNVYFFSYK
ncbi:MAG TPA: hypothetical protein GXX68_04340, partial [Defluviitoga tunisiensis]|nr:hypothetical protein [Defluviitoga tunisiensis]